MGEDEEDYFFVGNFTSSNASIVAYDDDDEDNSTLCSHLTEDEVAAQCKFWIQVRSKKTVTVLSRN